MTCLSYSHWRTTRAVLYGPVPKGSIQYLLSCWRVQRYTYSNNAKTWFHLPANEQEVTNAAKLYRMWIREHLQKLSWNHRSLHLRRHVHLFANICTLLLLLFLFYFVLEVQIKFNHKITIHPYRRTKKMKRNEKCNSMIKTLLKLLALLKLTA